MDITDVIRQHENSLLSLPNVSGIAVGEKAGKAVIKVFVTHKVPEELLQPQDIIPESLDGFETDVEEIGTVTAL